ncbi:MAG: PQQ-like beta-propeller repeat protein [Planctomycetia bacterium]|nr:PQQ-like beta-propeller repeat protein [Planctomycetia bacterium]
MRTRWLVLLIVHGLSSVSPIAAAPPERAVKQHDWPQWRGPDRSGVSREKGLLAAWPDQGLRLAWQVEDLGTGDSTPAVSAGSVYGMSFRGADEVVWALDELTGKERWVARIAAARRSGGAGDGSRSTPTVDGPLLYVLGVQGDLVCLDSATGKERWRRNMAKDFGGEQQLKYGGYSESLLIDGDHLICTPGSKQASLAALHKRTGAIVWQAQVPQQDKAKYSSVVAVEVQGLRHYVQFLEKGVVGVAATDGRFLWRYDAPANSRFVNCSTPVVAGDCVFAASAYGNGGGLVRLSRKGENLAAEEQYFTKKMQNQHGGMVLLDGYLYGSNEGLLTCLEFKTGKLMWDDRRPGKGSIAAADGHLYYRNERGPVFLIEANPKQYILKGRLEQPAASKQHTWAHPVLANGRLYLRDHDWLFCYDLKPE